MSAIPRRRPGVWMPPGRCGRGRSRKPNPGTFGAGQAAPGGGDAAALAGRAWRRQRRGTGPALAVRKEADDWWRGKSSAHGLLLPGRAAVASLVACATAGQVAFPSVSWNVDKVDAIKGDIKAYGIRQQAAQKADNEASVKSLSHAYASYKVGEYVIFGKYMKPIAEDHVVFFDELTVSGKCNQEVATQCVNAYMLRGDFDTHSKSHAAMVACVEGKAGCATDFAKLPEPAKKALANKYHTDVNNLKQAYGKLFERTGAELKVAEAQHKARQAAMRADFRKTANQVAATFGCDTKCLHTCGEQNDGNCFEKCHCGQGTISIQETYVNTYGIVKAEYGDIQNLNQQEVRTVNEAIQRF